MVTQDVQAGTLLLVCHPLCLAQGPAGIQLKPAALASQLTSHFQTSDQGQHTSGSVEEGILKAFFDGTSQTAAAMPLSLAALCSTQCISHQDPETTVVQGSRNGSQAGGIGSRKSSNRSSSSDGSSSAGSRDASNATSESSNMSDYGSQLSEQRLLRVVELNCFGEDSGDFTAWHCRGEEQTSYLGLYPGLAMANHSCTPNSACLVLSGGQAVALRCVTDLSSGQEVCISYLGGNIFSPLLKRRTLLSHSYGFECGCSRCLAEAAVAPEVGVVLEALNTQLCTTLRRDVNAALVAEDARALRTVRSKLLQLSVSAQAELVALETRPDAGDSAEERKLSIMLHSGVGLCYELLAMVSDALSSDGEGGSYLAPQRLQLLQAVSPGSYGQCELSARHWIRMQAAVGAEHVKTRWAKEACLAAHVARYGEAGWEEMAGLITGHEAGQDELAEVISEREAASRLKKGAKRWAS